MKMKLFLTKAGITRDPMSVKTKMIDKRQVYILLFDLQVYPGLIDISFRLTYSDISCYSVCLSAQHDRFISSL